MHRLPSGSVLRRFRLASMLVLFTALCLPGALGFLGYGLFTAEHHWLTWAGVCLGLAIFLLIANFLMSARLRCPLCMVPPLQNRGCSKHRDAQTLFGSHRLKVAQSILFTDSFRCPYCGEPTVMEVRKNGRR